ncbi:hypothetical protein ACRAWG_16480 [Methylobacterium sp. P31]
MFRLFSAALVVAVALPSLNSHASAASDITIAAITTGRLYVVGTTEHPHTAVMLDDRFRTESDENGKFQYELVYHPASCIVAATIEGVTHEAVVSSCGQQVMPGTWLEPHAAVDAPALLKRLMTDRPDGPAASFQPAKPLEQPQSPVSIPPSAPPRPVFTAAAWANLPMQIEVFPAGPTEGAVAAALASLGTASPELTTGATPHLPAASDIDPANSPPTLVRRQVRRSKVQPGSLRSSETVGIGNAAD